MPASATAEKTLVSLSGIVNAAILAVSSASAVVDCLEWLHMYMWIGCNGCTCAWIDWNGCTFAPMLVRAVAVCAASDATPVMSDAFAALDCL